MEPTGTQPVKTRLFAADAGLDAVEQYLERGRRLSTYGRGRLHPRRGLIGCGLVEAHLHCATIYAELVAVRGR